MNQRAGASETERDQEGQKAPAAAPVAPKAAQVLALQRSAGNAAVSAAIGNGNPVLARGLFGSGKKKEKKEESSGPTNVRPMSEEEKKGVLSMNELIARYQATLDKAGGGESEGIEDETAEGVGVMVAEAEKEARFFETLKKGGNDPKGEGISDETVEGVGKMMEDAEADAAAEDALSSLGDFYERFEAEFKAQMDLERWMDDQLYEGAKKLAASITGPGVAATATYSMMLYAIRTWQASPRRKLGLPTDKTRRQELEALIADKKWALDKGAADSAVLEPNPEMKSSDKTGYFASSGTELHELTAKGKLSGKSINLTKDFTFRDMPSKKVGGKKGYTFPMKGKTYWIDAANIVIKTGAKFEKVPGPLFPPDPDPAHVKQTTLGDCYLQAAVGSLAHRNPGLIKAMMRDNGDDSVTIRLYKPQRKKGKQPTFSARYVRIEKSIPKDFEGNEVYNAGATWVRMIEKAYAAGGFTGDAATKSPPKKSYEGIEGGWSAHAMEVLTGEPVDEQLHQGGWHADVSSTLPWTKAERTAYKNALSSGSYDELLSFKILGDQGLVDTWMQWVEGGDLDAFFKTQADLRGQGFAGDITLNDIEATMGTLDAGVRATMLGWLDKQQLYPGQLGSAKYSKIQLETFKRIQENLAAGKTVTTGTFKYPGAKKVAGTGASGGEVQHQGIVGSHAFSVLGARGNATTDPDSPKAGDFNWIQIRNPWGSYSRKYDFSKTPDQMGEAVEGGNGVSWIELSDLTRYFDGVDFG